MTKSYTAARSDEYPNLLKEIVHPCVRKIVIKPFSHHDIRLSPTPDDCIVLHTCRLAYTIYEDGCRGDNDAKEYEQSCVHWSACFNSASIAFEHHATVYEESTQEWRQPQPYGVHSEPQGEPFQQPV